MVLKTIDIRQAQPTDNLRLQQQEFYDTLDNPSFLNFLNQNPPQVWKLKNKLYISDGNNRVANAIKRGATKIPTDYQDKLNEMFIEYTEELLKLAEQFQQKGIYTPSDLWII